MWACSKCAHFFVITDCHTACISVQQGHLFSAVRHNSVSSAMAYRRMCLRIVIIFRCKPQHWHYCGHKLPLACFLVRPRAQISLPYPLDPVHQSWSHVSLNCAPSHHWSQIKMIIKKDINFERLYTPTLLLLPPASFILLFSSHLKGICLYKLSKSCVSKSVLSFPIGQFDLFPHSLLRQTEQSKEIFKQQKSHVADRAHQIR